MVPDNEPIKRKLVPRRRPGQTLAPAPAPAWAPASTAPLWAFTLPFLTLKRTCIKCFFSTNGRTT